MIQDSYNSHTRWIPKSAAMKVLTCIISAICFLNFTLFSADCLYLQNFQIVVVDNSWLAITERSSY